MSHQSTVPQAAADYFSLWLPRIEYPGFPPTAQVAGYHYHPVIESTFVPERGWVKYPFRKRISPTWARKLRAQGVTSVALRVGDRVADFTIKELVSR
jgi:hypothetical protein